jgi:stage II sporulation protein D
MPHVRILIACACATTTIAWWTYASSQARLTVSHSSLRANAVLQAADSITMSRVDQALIRVAVTASPQKRISLSIDGPYQIQLVGHSKSLSSGQRLSATTVTSTSTGLKIGQTIYPVTRLEITPKQSPSVWVNGHQYRGRMRFFRRSGGGVLAVNVLPMHEYLASVVDSEMPISFGVEARKAQAIVARTYALDVMSKDEGQDYDLFASTSSQKYQGFRYRDGSRELAGESEASRNIVRETTGMVCLFQGKLFRTYYSAVCGGQTTQGSALFRDAAAALKSVPCNFCREATRFRWKADLAKHEVADKLTAYFRAEGKTFGQLRSIKLVRGDPSQGTEVPEFEVHDGQRGLRISAAVLRRQLPAGTLESPFFSVTERGGRLYFEGRGHGHGVGLCQWGARGQALQGRTAIEIVHYYYSGSQVSRLL